MKKIIPITTLIFFIFGFYSCGDYAKFTYTVTKSVPVNYNLNVNGNFSQVKSVSEYDINNIFQIEEDAKIKKVTINSVQAKIEKQPETTAELLDVNGSLKIESTDGVLFDQNLLETFTETVPTIVNNKTINQLLNGAAIDKIKKFIQKAVDPLAEKTQTWMLFKINGRSYKTDLSDLFNPKNVDAQLNAKFTIVLNATITYSVCREVPKGIFGLKECD